MPVRNIGSPIRCAASMESTACRRLVLLTMTTAAGLVARAAVIRLAVDIRAPLDLAGRLVPTGASDANGFRP